MSRPLRRIDGDAGFTLVELLITIVILGVITLPLANLVIEHFKYTADTTSRLNESHDVQIAATYFARDVAGLGTRDQSTQAASQSVWVGSSSGAPYTCGSATPVVLFASDQFTGAGAPTVNEIAYVAAVVGSENRLTRVYCAGSSGAATSNVLAHDVDPSTAPAVTCYVGATAKPCSGSGSNLPTRVTLALTTKDAGNTGSSYSATLTGERRQS